MSAAGPIQAAAAGDGTAAPGPPVGLLAELTHRCPLHCPYCSNPLDLARRSAELDAPTWRKVLAEAARLGVLQVHLSGGEPGARPDLEEIVAAAREAGLYTTLVTAGVLLTRERVAGLAARGLEHVQLSLQHAQPEKADRIAGHRGAHRRKCEVARWVRAAGIALTVNAPVHRHNLDGLEAIIDLAVACGAGRLEIAHVQYYGWALANRAALMPTPAQVRRSMAVVHAARARLAGRLAIDFVAPDYYAVWPKPCMGGWGRHTMVVTPAGRVLPCHAAETVPGLVFDSVREKPLAAIWHEGEAFRKYRGTEWMREPCRRCPRRDIDWGGCRCQALAVTGDAAAADPACSKSPHHAALRAAAEREAALPPPPFLGRSGRRPAALSTPQRS